MLLQWTILSAENRTHLWQSDDMVFLCCWVRLSEYEYVWLSKMIIQMRTFLSESLGRPSGYFQAECWLLAESSLHSWTKLQPTILGRPQWLVKSRLIPLMHSLHGLQEKSSWSICDWGSRGILTVSPEGYRGGYILKRLLIVRYVVYHLCIRGWVGYWVSTYTSSRCKITSTRHSFTTMPKSR